MTAFLRVKPKLPLAFKHKRTLMNPIVVRTPKDVAKRIDLHVGSFYRLLARHANDMPPAHRLPGGRRIYFLEHEVEEWLANLPITRYRKSRKGRRGRPRRRDQSPEHKNVD